MSISPFLIKVGLKTSEIEIRLEGEEKNWKMQLV